MEEDKIKQFKELVKKFQKLAAEAITYIESVISDYEGTDHNSEFFCDVLMVEHYKYNKNPSGAIRRSTWGRKGLYVFIAANDFYMDSKAVQRYCSIYGAGFLDTISPQDIKAGDHFYQGSTIRKSLHTRLKEHYSNHSTQSAMCLNNPNRIIARDNVKVFIFPLRREFEQYSFFIRKIEEELHSKFPAKTGSSKTF